MNKMKFMVLFMSIAMIFGSCGSMNNTGKGAAIGGGSRSEEHTSALQSHA